MDAAFFDYYRYPIALLFHFSIWCNFLILQDSIKPGGDNSHTFQTKSKDLLTCNKNRIYIKLPCVTHN